jgi:hypothetical protein
MATPLGLANLLYIDSTLQIVPGKAALFLHLPSVVNAKENHF